MISLLINDRDREILIGISFDFPNLFRAMQSCAMSAKSSIILNFPRVWSHDLKWVKQTLADSVYGKIAVCKIPTITLHLD